MLLNTQIFLLLSLQGLLAETWGMRLQGKNSKWSPHSVSTGNDSAASLSGESRIICLAGPVTTPTKVHILGGQGTLWGLPQALAAGDSPLWLPAAEMLPLIPGDLRGFISVSQSKKEE